MALHLPDHQVGQGLPGRCCKATIVLLRMDRTQVRKSTGQCAQVKGNGAGRLLRHPRHARRIFAEHTGIDRIGLTMLAERLCKTSRPPRVDDTDLTWRRV